ncbi:hypothetical protein Tco_0211233 [Tanacetum coccineum]
MPRILIHCAPFWGCYRLSIKSQGYREPVSEDDSDIGSPGVDGPPIMPEVSPSPDYTPGPEGPPSPDYVPGPEEL